MSGNNTQAADRLPRNWDRVRVGEVLSLSNGFAFKPSHWQEVGLPIIRIQNLNNPNAPFNYSSEKFPDRFRIETGDLLFAWSGTPGTSFGAHIWKGGPAWLNQHIFRVGFSTQLFDIRFLQFAINQNLSSYISAAHGGAGLAHITKGKFEDSLIRVAPLNEQRRLVAEIEKQFSRLDDAVMALRRVQANLKRYRASVLKAAGEGRLVPTEAELARKEGRDYEPASELLKRILAERRAKWEADLLQKMIGAGRPPKDDKWKKKYKEPERPDTSGLPQLPEGWAWASTDQLASEEDYALAIGPFGSNLKVSDYAPVGVPLVFVRNIRSGDFSDSSSRFVSAMKARELSPHIIGPGDLLVTKMGDPPGDVCIYPEDRPPAVITADCIKLRLHPLLSSKKFFAIVLSCQLVRKQILLRTKGVAQLKISLARFKTVAVPLAPEAEQLRISTETERRTSILEDSSNEVKRQVTRGGRLKESILAQAFSGKLVPQNPNDEPASVLLERIRGERAAQATSTNTQWMKGEGRNGRRRRHAGAIQSIK